MKVEKVEIYLSIYLSTEVEVGGFINEVLG